MWRAFGEADQAAFAVLSGDANPLHVDGEAARRLMFDRALVHGLHGVLWALDCWLGARPRAWRLRRIAAEFRAPIAVGEGGGMPDRGRTRRRGAARSRGRGRPRADDGPRLSRARGPAGVLAPPPAASPPGACRERARRSSRRPRARCRSPSMRRRWRRWRRRVAAALPPLQVAVLLAATRLVGMECPGLHSVFSGFALDFDAAAPAAPALGYAVSRSTRASASSRSRSRRWGARRDPGAGAGAAGGAAGARRARGAGAAGTVAGRPRAGGGRLRGLGETCAKLLAAGGAEVALTYARGAADAARVAAEIAAGGGRGHAAARGQRRAAGLGRGPRRVAAGDLFYFATRASGRRRTAASPGRPTRRSTRSTSMVF